MNKVGISFKDTEKDLYDFLKKQLSPSIYIKQLLKEKMDEEDKTKDMFKTNFDF